ncbi:DVU0298 family protein [Desulfolucanica intricata]|uniref:DVU0298 family protein n=1 Tax=Desulfolucanica intricata TaxID=1285191 RepID=UPI00082F0603|nr:DVU0298 family protein [Desulfolucanica intricata]
MNTNNNSKLYSTGSFKKDYYLVKPTCPFCGMLIERPKELDTRRPGEMPVGSCSCGAVYAFDITGHNLGAAYAEALVFGCNMDWDLAWDLLPEEDYLQAIIENYDMESNLIVSTGSYEGRRVTGALYFIKLHRDIQEFAQQGVQKKLEKAKTVTSDFVPPADLNTAKKYSKKEIEAMVSDYKVELLVDIARRDKRIIRDLQRLLYSGDELLRLRATEILGRVSAIIANRDPGAVAKLLQRLFSNFSEPGTSGWGAIESIGEIIANSPDIYAGYISTLYQSMEDELLRPKVLKAITRIAEVRPELIKNRKYYFTPLLSDPNPEIRGYTALLLGYLGIAEAKSDLEKLCEDEEEIDIYENGEIVKKTVRQLAVEALNNVS